MCQELSLFALLFFFFAFFSPLARFSPLSSRSLFSFFLRSFFSLLRRFFSFFFFSFFRR